MVTKLEGKGGNGAMGRLLKGIGKPNATSCCDTELMDRNKTEASAGRLTTIWDIYSPVGATHEVTINSLSHAKRVQFS